MPYIPEIHNRRSIRMKGYDYSGAGLYFITICCEGMKCRFGKIENREMILNDFGTVAYNEWAKLPERFLNMELDVFQIMPNHFHAILALKNVGAGFTPAQSDAPGNSVGAGFTPALNAPQDNHVGAALAAAQSNADVQPDTDAQPDAITNANTGRPQGSPLQSIAGGDNRATARGAPTSAQPDTAKIIPKTNATLGDILGAYKSLVTNACIDICNLKHVRLGKFWQRNFHDHIIRDEESYHKIADYIMNNPKNWETDKFYEP